MTSSGAPLTIWKSFKINPEGTLLAASLLLEGGVISLAFVSTLMVGSSRTVYPMMKRGGEFFRFCAVERRYGFCEEREEGEG
jgi:hypothetical protein